MEKEEALKRQLEEVQAERAALEEDRECRRAMQDKADVVRIIVLIILMTHLLPPYVPHVLNIYLMHVFQF